MFSVTNSIGVWTEVGPRARVDRQREKYSAATADPPEPIATTVRPRPARNADASADVSQASTSEIVSVRRSSFSSKTVTAPSWAHGGRLGKQREASPFPLPSNPHGKQLRLIVTHLVWVTIGRSLHIWDADE